MNSSTTLEMLHNPERYFMAIDWWIKPTFGLLIWCQWDVHPPARKHSSWKWPCRAHQVRIMNIQLQDLSKLNVPWFAHEIPTNRLIVSLLYFYIFLWPFRNLKLISMLSFHDCNSRSGSAPNRSGLQFFSNPILHWTPSESAASPLPSGTTWHQQHRRSHRHLRCQWLQCGLSDDRVGSGWAHPNPISPAGCSRCNVQNVQYLFYSIDGQATGNSYCFVYYNIYIYIYPLYSPFFCVYCQYPTFRIISVSFQCRGKKPPRKGKTTFSGANRL